jgi:7-cyano-7-deazaguanine synthase in queuosine biosynthesis
MNNISSLYSVDCTIRGFQSWTKPQLIRFNLGSELSYTVDGLLGPSGVSTTAADLLDFASAVFQIERLMRGRGGINRPEHIIFRMKLRNPEAWNTRAIQTAQAILHLLGNATWELQFIPGSYEPKEYNLDTNSEINQVVLFSGGMDSTCGAMTMGDESNKTQLVSFYGTHQKNVQIEIASELGYRKPTQWHLKWSGPIRPGGTFYYRSFLFLSIASVVARSWNASQIYQFENGILASAIPPGPTWMMTKHAHPELHAFCEDLFSELYGNVWKINNPFLSLTKRECFEKSVNSLGSEKAHYLIDKTETCWFQWSNRIKGGKKTPGKPCGVCVPCLVRRTAVSDGKYAFDLIGNEKLRNNEDYGIAFQSYYHFASQILRLKNEFEFYELIPTNIDFLVGSLSLFRTFAEEFWTTYNIGKFI